jgi:hypothetical protein
MAIRAELTERRSFKDRCMWRPGNWKNNQEISVYHQSSTYRTSGVALEGASVDLHLGATGIDCTALLSWMSGPRTWKKFQERSAGHHSSTYVMSGVGVEGRVMDDKSSILNEDGSSALKVVCGAPGHRAKISVSSFSRGCSDRAEK